MSENILRKLIVVSIIALTSYTFIVGCGNPTEDDPDATYSADTATPDVNVPPNNAPDLGPNNNNPTPDLGSDMAAADLGGDMAAPDMGGDMTVATSYRFVRIADLDGATTDTTEHLGADIDAVELDQNGTRVFAQAPTSTGADAAYPEGLEGAQLDVVCQQGLFVSIGTGPMVFQFEGAPEISSGDIVTVYEVDANICAASGPDTDSYEVSIGVSADPNGTWLALGTCDEGQPCALPVP